MKKNIIATNGWFRDRHLLKQGGWYALAVYMVLQKMQQMDGKIITSIGELIEYMMADRKNETVVSSVKGAIKFLAQEGLIVLYEDIHMMKQAECDLKNAKTGQALYMRIGELPTREYTQVTVDELNTIMSNPRLKSKQKAQVLSYFMAIISHVDTKTKIAFPSFDALQEEAQIGRRDNCKQFNEVLREMGLLIYANAGVVRVDGEGRVSNTYARPQHRAELDADIERLRQTHRRNYSELEKYDKADMKRSLKQKINILQRTREERGELTVKEQRQLDKLQEEYNQL